MWKCSLSRREESNKNKLSTCLLVGLFFIDSSKNNAREKMADRDGRKKEQATVDVDQMNI